MGTIYILEIKNNMKTIKSIKFVLSFLIIAFFYNCSCQYSKTPVSNEKILTTSLIDTYTDISVGIDNDNKVLIRADNKNKLGDGDGYTDADSVFMFPEILFRGNKVQIDTTRAAYSLKTNDIKYIDYKGIHYLLIKQFDINDDFYEIFTIKNNQFVKIGEAFTAFLKDFDGDSILEVGGIGSREAYCSKCDSMYYSPALLYKLGKEFVLDSISSKKLTIESNGIFLGFDSGNKIVLKPK